MAEPSVPRAVWLSTPHQAAVEIAHGLGCRHFVLDIEHGFFGLDATDKLVALILALGAEVHAKVLGPETIPIQQALDIGCSGVIIPHIRGADHAARVTAAAKYPPLGVRSFAGTRPARYDTVAPDWFEAENRRTRCWPMIETAEALAEVEAIAALPTVDGLFLGPYDLSLRRGRGAYRRTEADFADLSRVARAARAEGKDLVMPAWTAAERDWATAEGAALLVTVDEYGALWTGFEKGLSA